MVTVQSRDLRDLQDSVTFNGKDIKSLKLSLQKTKDENKKLQDNLTLTNNSLKATKKKLEGQLEESERLSEELDSLELYTRKSSLEIHGIPQDAYTSTEDIVIKVGEALNGTIEPDDTDISHKINHGKVILVKFVS